MPRSRSAAEKSNEGFVALVNDSIDRIYRFLLGMTGDPEAAADLTQQTFLNVARSWRRHGKSGPPIAYLFTTARNAASSRLRRLKLERSHLRPLPENPDAMCQTTTADPDSQAENSELRAALSAALGTLEPEQRAVFLMSEVDGMKYKEIAAVLGCRTGTVGSRKHAAVEKLRSELRRMGHAL